MLLFEGGRSFPSSLNSIEVMNTRNPRRWVTLPRLALPVATYGHCAAPVNETAMLIAGGFGSEAQSIVIDLKSKRWQPTDEPMKQPRREVSVV